MKLQVVGKMMLKFEYLVEQKYGVGEWMVDFAMD